MAGKKIKINPKRFVRDFRSGMSDDELMLAHGLTPMALEKVLRMLEGKHLLDVAEISRDVTVTTTRRGKPARRSRPRPIAEESTVLAPVQAFPDPKPKESASRCSQCGAEVPEIALTCPECGHVLSGSQRWEEPESEETLLDRIPPLLWGCILAIPFLIVFYLILTYYVLPASESRIDKRIATIREEAGQRNKANAANFPLAADPLVGRANEALDQEIQTLIADGILTDATEDLTLFHTGDRWSRLSEKELAGNLARIALAMRNAQLGTSFEVVDTDGWTVATCTEQGIQIFKDGLVTNWKWDQSSQGAPQAESGATNQGPPPPQ